MGGVFRRLIQTVDSHTEGNSTRVITGGYPLPPGRTLLEQRQWLWRNDGGLRRGSAASRSTSPMAATSTCWSTPTLCRSASPPTTTPR